MSAEAKIASRQSVKKTTAASKEKETKIAKEMKEVKETKETKETNTKREVYYTPDSAFAILEPFLRNHKAIWDPAAGADRFPVKDYFEAKGFRVATSDLAEGKEYDFFTHKTKKRYDVIVTTPPYSYRKEFLERAFELKKTFAMLVPVNVLESKTVRDLFKIHKVCMLMPSKTISFSSPNDNRSVKALPYSMWVLSGFEKLPDIVYA